jgi:hypothetical protein
MNEVGGLAGRISKANIATVSRNKARYDRSLRHVAEHSLTSTFTTEEQLGELAARVRVAAIEPPSMQIVRTPLDGQAGQMEREQLKIAVGAESASHAIKTGLTPLEKLRRNARPVGRNGEGHARPDPFAKLRERNHAW